MAPTTAIDASTSRRRFIGILQGGSNLRVVVGLDPTFTTALWSRVASNQTDAEKYQALPNSIQFSAKIDDTVTSLGGGSVCFDFESLSFWQEFKCPNFQTPASICAADGYNCGSVNVPCLSQPASCGTCNWRLGQACMMNQCGLIIVATS
jgi:hypothetical protein